MSKLRFNGYHKLTRSTMANASFEPILYTVTPEFYNQGKATGLPEAGDVIEIRNMPANILIYKIDVWQGAAWAGGAIDIGWTIEGAHPDDQVQDSTHNVPRVDNTLFGEEDRFGAGITPAVQTAPGAQGIKGVPVGMLDYQYNGNQPWRAFNWNLTIKPAANLAAGDELLMLLHYQIVAS